MFPSPTAEPTAASTKNNLLDHIPCCDRSLTFVVTLFSLNFNSPGAKYRPNHFVYKLIRIIKTIYLCFNARMDTSVSFELEPS